MPDAAPAPLDIDAFQRALGVLLDVGTALARELETPSETVSLAARATAFARVAEAVRRTIILAKHLADAAPVRDTKRTLARRQVIRAVEENIGAKAKPDAAAALRIELLERIDAPEFVDDLDHRDPKELIQELCQDLGLANLPGVWRFPRRTPDDIAILCAQAAAAPGSGLPQWLAATQAQAAKNDAQNDIRLKEA